jgi:transposase
LGWRVRVTNAPAARLSLLQAVQHCCNGWTWERDFHLVKDLLVGLSPLFVWKDDQREGLTRLLTLALRLLTLLETQARHGLEHTQAAVAGLYEGQPTRTTEQPTGKRLLRALAGAEITLAGVRVDAVSSRHLTPLSPRHAQLLRYLHLPASL